MNSITPSPAGRRLGLRSAAALIGLASLGGIALAVPNLNFDRPAQADGLPALNTPTPALPAMSPLPAMNMPGSFADLAAKVSPAVVNISSTHVETAQAGPEIPDFPKGSPFEQFFKPFLDQQKHGQMKRKLTALGSGFIIDPSGYIVTNNHVIDQATDIHVTTNDGKDYPAKLIGADSKTDLALLKIEAKTALPSVAFGNSDQARVGDWVLAVGNPFGLGGTVTTGIISARSRDIHEGPFDDFLQIDASINQGNSGGPTFDMAGNVIGINTAIYSPSGGSVGIGFAIPANLAKPILAELKDKGAIERGWLGVEIQEVTPDIAKAIGLPEAKGALVANVQPDSPASKAHLKAGDVVLSFNGQPVAEMKDLPRLVAEADPNTKVELGILREKKAETVAVTLGKLKDQDQVASTDSSSPDSAPSDSQQVDALGATLVPTTPETRQQFNLEDSVSGVIVADLQADSPLADQGIRAGDVIERVSDAAVSSPADVKRLADEAKAQKQNVLLMLVQREGRDLFVAVKLDNA